MAQKVTIKSIALRAHVNPATVSRALNPATASLISEKVRAKIRTICDELGYRPALSARSTATGKTFKIGLILGAMLNDFSAHNFARTICGLSDELQRKNYALTILHADPSKNLDRQVCDFLMSGIADGYVTGSSMPGSDVLKLLQKLNVPLRTICDPHSINPSICHVMRDITPALRQIWQNIPEKWRHQTLFFANNIPDNITPLRDIENCGRELFGKHISVPSLLYERSSRFNSLEYRDAYHSAARNLEFIKKYKVIWCESDFTAAALYDQLIKNDVKVGKDILLVGIGDLENYRNDYTAPVIATINFNAELIGKELVRSLIDEINGKPPVNVKIDATFIPRKTFPIKKEV